MAPSKTGKTGKMAAAKPKKEKVYHPESRKAGQLARKSLRKGKLGNLASNRGKKHNSLVDIYGFFYHAMPEEGVLAVEELHTIVRDIWLTRHDTELEEEIAARRKGRPKSAKEMKLEEIKLRESEEYRTGMEVPDLTHAPTVELFRRWDQKEVAFIQLLRFIRISSVEPETVVVSRPGKHRSLLDPSTAVEDAEMEVVEEVKTGTMGMPTDSLSTPILLTPTPLPLMEPPGRFASTMMTMDGPLL